MKRQMIRRSLGILLAIVSIVSLDFTAVSAQATEGIAASLQSKVANSDSAEAGKGAPSSAGAAAALAALEADTATTTTTEVVEEETAVVIPQNNTVVVNGVITKTTLDGHYYAYSIPGLAVVSSLADLQKQANFMVLEYFFVSTWDLYKYTAPQAVETMDIIAKSQNAELGATFQMTVSRYFSTKVYPYENDEMQVTTKVSIPTAFRSENNTYAMVYVKNGGAYEILPDLDDEPTTITYNAHAGTGAYGIIKYLDR